MSNYGELKLDIDIEAIETYQKQVLLAESQLANFEQRYLNTLANRLIQKVVPRTPVAPTTDSHRGGLLRRSWKVSNVTSMMGMTTITVYNDARGDGMDESYASYVELGHETRNVIKADRHWVEGRFMLTISTDEIKEDMMRVWNAMYNDWLKEVGLK